MEKSKLTCTLGFSSIRGQSVSAIRYALLKDFQAKALLPGFSWSRINHSYCLLQTQTALFFVLADEYVSHSSGGQRKACDVRWQLCDTVKLIASTSPLRDSLTVPAFTALLKRRSWRDTNAHRGLEMSVAPWSPSMHVALRTTLNLTRRGDLKKAQLG